MATTATRIQQGPTCNCCGESVPLDAFVHHIQLCYLSNKENQESANSIKEPLLAKIIALPFRCARLKSHRTRLIVTVAVMIALAALDAKRWDAIVAFKKGRFMWSTSS